ncbi:Coenzyme F420 hydrogenase/dehydrogenase, beta subunit C-terminal domain [Parabacteroides pacaensis]|uniref:Coenzyme F420 hydrogenase/dehydrogenase, beta subunit C-terminal domain n=1 Tax=Parabacteroides pacaensis TaxID=2086575 RepID=UPI000D1014CF|nr:Coenzyme F420 hydrogenase/dehydrogenase, beta subunit C-terminal domain [Parabacteroides pacaensis]
MKQISEICPKEKCTGCQACVNICNKDAIKIDRDELGFSYPFIDPAVCVNCGLCGSVCPNNSDLPFNLPLKAIIANASDEAEQKTSTSGGLASVFARHIISCHGVVYGCSGADGKNVKHIRVESEAELLFLKGSKYVQSEIGETYRLAKHDLQAKRLVLFIGTPCQVAGLKSFLGQECENLYTIDFVCHGVPSQQLLNDHISQYVTPRDSYSISFRKKNVRGHSHYGVFVSPSSQTETIAGRYPDDYYITGFLQGLFYRESCYDCHYARKERVTDITLGDYWDRENNCKTLKNRKYGLSMLMVNTAKGQFLFKNCQHFIDYQPGELNDFIKRNAQLARPIAKHIHYDNFKKEYLTKGFKDAAQKYLANDIKMIKRSLLISRISTIIYKLPFMKVFYKKLLANIGILKSK